MTGREKFVCLGDGAEVRYEGSLPTLPMPGSGLCDGRRGAGSCNRARRSCSNLSSSSFLLTREDTFRNMLRPSPDALRLPETDRW